MAPAPQDIEHPPAADLAADPDDGPQPADAPAAHAPAQTSMLSLLRQQRFGPFFLTQFLGAFNDNVFKNALLILIVYQSAEALAGRWDSIGRSVRLRLIHSKPHQKKGGGFPCGEVHVGSLGQVVRNIRSSLEGVWAGKAEGKALRQANAVGVFGTEALRRLAFF